MKTLKLTAFEAEALSNKEMSNVLGGTACGCGCKYANDGGSSTDDNGKANNAGGKTTVDVPFGSIEIVVTP